MAHDGKGWKSRGRDRILLVLALLGLSAAYAQEVTLQIRAPGAHHVFVCGSFRDWRCLSLHRAKHGVFRGRIAVAPGLYEYGFKVDGHWRVTRHAARVSDGFGGRNNLLVVGR
ncbi:MAG: glycogen-binding domain-containing protein [Acidiferrobacter sp.]